MDITGKRIRLSGVLHAGTWDKKDFTVRYGMDAWAKGFEETRKFLESQVVINGQMQDIVFSLIRRVEKLEGERSYDKRLN